MDDHKTAHCMACQYADGSPDADALSAIGACLFGCGHRVDQDTGICSHCSDHSCNYVECQECGREYEQWGGTWTPMSRNLMLVPEAQADGAT